MVLVGIIYFQLQPQPVSIDTTSSTSTLAYLSTTSRAVLATSSRTSVINKKLVVENDRPIIKDTLPKVDGKMKIMAWVYPGNPSCGAKVEYSDGRKIDVLKAEYFAVSDGELMLLTEANSGCNGYSAANIASIKAHSSAQYATVSSLDKESTDAFLQEALKNNTEIQTLVNFTVTNGITGIEIDFEDFPAWSPAMYTRYKQFVTKLGNALHDKGKKLLLDTPPISSQEEQNWSPWRYSDFVTLPVDGLVVMAYDYQYDYGAAEGVSPLTWIKNIINWTSAQYPKEKITIGIPSYGYKGTVGGLRYTILTQEQAKNIAGYSTAVRDADTKEMTWRSGSTVYFYSDSVSMNSKLKVIQDAGITSVSVWHLGGNPWFSY